MLRNWRRSALDHGSQPGGPAEILEGGRHGRLMPVGEADALAAAIEVALDDPGDAAARRARAADFSVRAATRRYLAQLDSLYQSGGLS